jgi:hypothetical protein
MVAVVDEKDTNNLVINWYLLPDERRNKAKSDNKYLGTKDNHHESRENYQKVSKTS